MNEDTKAPRGAPASSSTGTFLMYTLRSMFHAALFLLFAAGGPAYAGDTKLCLLGTAGGPGATVERAGIASLLEVGGHRYLIDAGAGVARQLARLHVRESDIPVVFITHLHDDHTSGLAELMTTAWTLRTPGMQILGPPRTEALVQAIVSVLQFNAEIRMAENPAAVAPSARFSGKDVLPGVIYQDPQITVSAAENSHFNLAAGSLAARNRSYALRIQTRDRSIAFTGDTGPSAAVEALAAGADVLVAETATSTDLAAVPEQVRRHMELEHLSPREVGKLATRARVKKLVLSHVRSVSAIDLAKVQGEFAGSVALGEDLRCY